MKETSGEKPSEERFIERNRRYTNLRDNQF
jgi:hypothetical protein